MWIFGDADVGKKNIVFGIALFLILGVGVGIPLTIDFFGGSNLGDQYPAWKVVHGYAVFLSFINYFVGLSLDRWPLTKLQKETASWSFVIAGLAAGLGRPALLLVSALDTFGIYMSLIETVFISLGAIVFLIGQVRGRTQAEKAPARPGRDATHNGLTHGVA